MPALLLAVCTSPADPAAPSLLAAVQARLPHDWTTVPAPTLRSAWRRLQSGSALAFLGNDRICGRGRRATVAALALSLAARSAGRRVALVGIPVAPSTDLLGRRAVRLLAESADLLVLADDRSATALVEAGVPAPLRVGSDPAWAALSGPVPAVEREERALVAVGSDSPEDELVPLLRLVGGAGLRVGLQPWERFAGPATARSHALARELRDADVLDPVADLHEARRRFAGARLVIAAPVRARYAAAAASTPFLAAGTSGAPRLAAALARLAAADGNLSASLHDALAGTAPDPSVVAAEVAAAEESLWLLRLLLSDGEDAADEIGRGTRLAPEPWSR